MTTHYAWPLDTGKYAVCTRERTQDITKTRDQVTCDDCKERVRIVDEWNTAGRPSRWEEEEDAILAAPPRRSK